MSVPDHLPASPYAIIGLGLVGGSLARALRTRLGAATQLIAVDPNAKAREAALRDGVVDEAFGGITPEVGECGLVVVCTPFGTLDALLPHLAAQMRPQAVLTDVIGLKAEVERSVRAICPRLRYVGAHPMAGGARAGFAASDANLFQGRTVVVCPNSADAEATAAVSALWRSVGADIVTLTPEEHDRIVAATSHLPYLAALSLVRLAEREQQGMHVAGRGFADATRRAEFEPEVMAAVAGHNPFMPAALRALADEMRRLADLIEASPDALLQEAALARSAHRKLGGEPRS